jgi:hypothetical protein
MSDQLDQRRQWFETYINRVEQGILKPPQPGIRYPCPCCGYLTLSERGGYDICELCNWEDDGQDDPHADEVWGGPNGAHSLTEARANFRRYLIMYGPDKPKTRIVGGDSALDQQAKRAIMRAFDAMVGETDHIVVERLWQQVTDNERLLRSELHRKIRESEAGNQNDNSSNRT